MLNLLHYQIFDFSCGKNLIVNSGKHKINVKWDFIMHSLMPYMEVSWDLGKVQLLTFQNVSCLISFDRRLVSQFGSFLAYHKFGVLRRVHM